MSARRVFLVLLLVFVVQDVWGQPSPERPRNVIMMIADGFGPASVTMARDYAGRPLALDRVLTGSVRTWASNSRVTDSAASATAYACGVKTYNGAIAVDSLGRPVATLLEAAKTLGMATGLLSTARLTHATPAAYSSHVVNRALEQEIAVQQINMGIDVMLGGGLAYYLPRSKGGSREDDRNLLREARDLGYEVAEDPEEFHRLNATPAIGLFTRSHMSYEIDRDPEEEPSLADMTRKALALLSDQPGGFLLVIEAGRIDHAAHGNDAAGHVQDILAYDEAVAEVLAFVEEDGETLMVATADHETGGLTLGRNIKNPNSGREGGEAAAVHEEVSLGRVMNSRAVYGWNPDVLKKVVASAGTMAASLIQGGDPDVVFWEYAGIEALHEEEKTMLREATRTRRFIVETIGEIISHRALVGWTSYGHTAVDVNLYAAGPAMDRFRGNLDNTQIGVLIAELLELDLEAQTRMLRAAIEPSVEGN